MTMNPVSTALPGPGSLGRAYIQTHPKGLLGAGLAWLMSRCRVSLSCSCQPWTWMWTPLGTKQICLPFQATQGSQGHLTQVDGETVCPHLPLRWLCSEVKARPVSISWKNSHSAPAEPTHEDPVRVYRACGALTHTRCWWRMLGTLPYFLLWIYYFLLLKYFLQSVKFGSSQNLNLYVLFLNVLRVDTWK